MAGLGGHRRFCDGLMAASDLVCMDPNDLLLDVTSSSSTATTTTNASTVHGQSPSSSFAADSATDHKSRRGNAKNGTTSPSTSVSAGRSLDHPVVLPRAIHNNHGQVLVRKLATKEAASSSTWRCLQSKLTPVQVGIALSSWDLGCYVAAKVVAPSWTDAVLQRLQEDANKAEKEGTVAAAAIAASSASSNGNGPPKKKTKRQSAGASGKKSKKEVDEWWREVTSAVLVAPWESYAADLLHDLPIDNVYGSAPTTDASNGSSSCICGNTCSNTVARGVLHALHAGLVRAVVSAPRSLFGAWTDVPASRVHGSTWLMELLRHAKDLLDARDAERAGQAATAAAEAAAAKARALKLAERRVAQFDQGPHNNNSALDDLHHDDGDGDNEGDGVDAGFNGSGGAGEGEEGNASNVQSAQNGDDNNDDGSSGLSKGASASSTAAASSSSFGSTKALLQYKKPSRARDEVGDEAILDESSFALLEELMRLTSGARSKLGLSDDGIGSSSETLAAMEQGDTSSDNKVDVISSLENAADSSSNSSTTGVNLYAALSLEERVAVGDCLYHLALESHVLRANSLKSMNALQTLHKCRSTEYARLPPLISTSSTSSSNSSGALSVAVVDDEAQLARRTLARK